MWRCRYGKSLIKEGKYVKHEKIFDLSCDIQYRIYVLLRGNFANVSFADGLFGAKGIFI